MPTVDLSNVDANAFSALPRGTYKVVVDRPPEIRTSAQGNDGAFWLFKVTEVYRTTPAVDDPSTLVDRTVPHNTSFATQALFNLKRTLIALGADPESLEGQVDIDEEFLAEFEGREAVVTLSQREYQGETQNNVSAIRAVREDEASL